MDRDIEIITCKEIEPLLDGCFDGELSASEMHTTKEHLGQCDDCQAKLKEIQSVSQALAALPKLNVKRDLAESILQKAQAKPSSEKNNVVLFKRKEFLAVVAGVLLIGLLVQFLNQAPIKVAEKPQEIRSPEYLSQQSPEQIIKQSKPAQAKSKPAIASSTKDLKLAIKSNKPASKISPVQSHTTVEKLAIASRGTEDVLAFDYGYQPNLMEGMGIATDEDGLYALKM